jgi:hypothetical protein
MKDSKVRTIVYWISTLWMCLGMTATGIAQWVQPAELLVQMNALGIPRYLLGLIAVLKIMGVVVLLLPRLRLLKEWAYAGCFFLMIGALYVHAANQDQFSSYFGPGLLLVLTFTSWYTRPISRRIELQNFFS